MNLINKNICMIFKKLMGDSCRFIERRDFPLTNQIRSSVSMQHIFVYYELIIQGSYA